MHSSTKSETKSHRTWMDMVHSTTNMTEKLAKPNLIRVQKTIRTKGDSVVYVGIHHAGEG